MLQIVKCNKITRCTQFRSPYKNVEKDRFLPSPFAMPQSLDNGFTWARSDKASQYLLLHQTVTRSGVIPTFIQHRYPLGIHMMHSIQLLWKIRKIGKLDVFSLWDVFFYNQSDVDAPPVLQACWRQGWKQQHIGCGREHCWNSNTTSNCFHTTTKDPLCFADARNGMNVYGWHWIQQHRRCTCCETFCGQNPCIWPHNGESWCCMWYLRQ